MIQYYALDGREAKPVSYAEWMKSLASSSMILKRSKAKRSTISTVFLGLSVGPNKSPLLFETMVFDGKHDGYARRYNTMDEAEAGHKEIVAMVLAGADDDTD